MNYINSIVDMAASQSMLNVDRACLGYSLRFASTLASGIYAGAAAYASIVEVPARRTHDAETAVRMWKPSFLRAKFYMSKLIFISVGSGLGGYWCSEERVPHEWLLAGGMMFSLLPVTAFILPINAELLDTDKCIAKGNDYIVDKMNSWSKRHAVRTVISLGAFGYMIWLLSK